VVFSDDDMVWKPGAEDKFKEIWTCAPDDVKVVSGLLEKVWHWNTARETVQCGNVPILVRDSCPGAGWSFRMNDWDMISKLLPDTFGYDHKTCVALLKKGFRVAQVDLAEHIGWGCSTHGNEADEGGVELDRERWGV